MATFTLSGSGTHAITAGTGALHVHVTTLPTIRGAGRAEPTNYYDLGLLRLGDGTYWWPSIPIDAEFQLLGCPQGTLEIAYALFNGTELSVVEVAGANPLAGSRALEDLSDVLIASVANNDVLKWNASASKWENGTASTVATLEDLTDVLIASVANGQVLAWNSSAGKWENSSVSGGGARVVLLTYDEASDVSLVTNTTTWATWHSHTFTVTDASAPIEFHVAGYTVGDNGGGHGMGSRILLDSTTVFALSGMFGGNSDPFGGGCTALLGTLSVGSHTVDVQMRGDSGDTIRCRASSRAIYGERYSVFITQG